MHIALGVFAAVILIVYFVYFIRILKGNPQDFEQEIIEALGMWMKDSKSGKGRSLWPLLLSSVVLEAVYFALVLITLKNPVVITLTMLLIALEFYHLRFLSVTFRAFMAGEIDNTKVFNWRIERWSASALFTYSFIILLVLLML